MSVPSSIVCFKQIDSYGLILARQSLGGMRARSLSGFIKNILGHVHMETHLAVYVNVLYRICVSSRRIKCFGSLKPLFFETGSQSG